MSKGQKTSRSRTAIDKRASVPARVESLSAKSVDPMDRVNDYTTFI